MGGSKLKAACLSALVVALLLAGGGVQPAWARVAHTSLPALVAHTSGRQAVPLHLFEWPPTVAPGAALTVAGTGYPVGETVRTTLGGLVLTTAPAVVTTDTQGNFIAAATVPANSAAGPALLVASGAPSGASAHTTVTVRRPVAVTWYFAGLDTRGGMHSRIAVLNPDNSPALLTLHLARADGPAVERTLTMAGHSRTTLDPAALAGSRPDLFFVRLSADRRVFAAAAIERDGGPWSNVPGVSKSRRTWFLAAGYADSATHQYEYLRLYNPASSTARVAIHVMLQHGPSRLVSLVLAGDRGRELDLTAYVRGQAVGALIQSSAPLVVQRLSVFGPGDVATTASTGVAEPAAQLAFPVGIAPSGARTVYAVVDPDPSSPAAVTALFYAPGRKLVGRATVVLAPRQRGTFFAPPGSGAATMVVLSSNIPVVAERTILLPAGSTPLSPGASAYQSGAGSGYTVGPATALVGQVFADGNTGGGLREYLVLENGTGQTARVGIEFYTTRGSALHLDRILPAYTRSVVVVNDVAGLPVGEHSAVILSSGVPVFAEQRIVSAAPPGGPGSACTLLLPRADFPAHMTQWVSVPTTPNAGALTSGLQQATYNWGYIVVTPDRYSTVAAARQRYARETGTQHGGQQAHVPSIGQQMGLWVRVDTVTHYTITMLLLRAGTTVAAINVGAGGPSIGMAESLARALATHACG